MFEKEVDADDIDDINNITEIFRIMESLGVSRKGLRTLDEMKRRVKETLRLSEQKSSWTAKEVRFSRSGSARTVELRLDAINFGLGTGDLMQLSHAA